MTEREEKKGLKGPVETYQSQSIIRKQETHKQQTNKTYQMLRNIQTVPTNKTYP